MKFITGFDRSQAVLFPTAIDDLIAADNIVRVIDVFVDSLNMKKLGFQNISPPAEGRPPYHPADLLKLYIYGYLNRYRSSRVLERECQRNVELIWLLRGLQPDHNTISNFRRDNPQAIKQIFRQTVEIARNLDLIGGVLLAGDSSKFRAQNSKKNNCNQTKIKRHVEYIDRKLEQYNQALAEADGDKEKQERRLLTILGKDGLKQVLTQLIPSFFHITDLGRAVCPNLSSSNRINHLEIRYFSALLKKAYFRWKMAVES